MQSPKQGMIRTRTTLIRRLKNWEDEASWQDFFDTYQKLIFGVAIKSGLSGTEAEDVVQETMLAIAKKMQGFEYDRSTGSFKAWLLNNTRWRIVDLFRNRHPGSDVHSESEEWASIVDQTSFDVQALWDAEWQKNLLEAAWSKVKRGLDPKHYQIFDLYVNKDWTPQRVAKTMKVPVGQVYLAKNRVTVMLKQEVERLKVQIC